VTALILKSTLLLLVTAGAAWLLRRQSAGLVHRVWMAGLVAALALPLLNLLAPQWGPLALWGFDSLPEAGPWLDGFMRYVWPAGVAVGLGVMLVGTGRLAWLVLHAEPLLDANWNDIAADLSRELKLRRRVQLLKSRDGRFLGTWGIWRPRILLPATALGWSPERVRAVLAHELAHIVRGDWPIQVLAEAARAIYWFNPLFWILVRRLRRESEHAADNIVLGLGVGQTRYARELLEVSHELGAAARQGPILAVAQPSFLEQRLVAVLHPGLKRVAATPWATLVIVLLAVGVSVPLAMLRDATGGASGSTATSNAAGLPSPSSGYVCPVTETIRETPPDATLAASFGEGPWHINEDRSIWVWAQDYRAGASVNAIWLRPEGTRLAVTAERLDGDAPAVEAEFNCCFPQLFKSGGIEFPTPGCWRVNATAGDRRLTFVTEVSR